MSGLLGRKVLACGRVCVCSRVFKTVGMYEPPSRQSLHEAEYAVFRKSLRMGTESAVPNLDSNYDPLN